MIAAKLVCAVCGFELNTVEAGILNGVLIVSVAPCTNCNGATTRPPARPLAKKPVEHLHVVH